MILGIDPGSRVTGYAVLGADANNKLTAIRCDVIRLEKIADHADRLRKLFAELTTIVGSHRPFECAIETPVYGKDPLAMLKLGRAQAACILAMATNDVPVTEYYPKMVKKSITGNGNASKEQVAFMIRNTVRIHEEKVPKDATDALAVAWCHMLKLSKPITQPAKKMHQNNKVNNWADFAKKNPGRIKGL